MNLDPFFLFVGVCAAFVATTAIGVSAAIVLRRIRDGRSERLKHVLPLAISWNIFACLFTYRFWIGVYDPHVMRDRLTLLGVLVAFTAGGWGLYFLWSHPYPKGNK